MLKWTKKGDYSLIYDNFLPVFHGLNQTTGNDTKQYGDIFDLADAFLSIASMTHKKLQKLCYYAKAWYLTLNDTNLIAEPFEAWVSGAVQPDLYQKYKVYGFGYIPLCANAQNIPEKFIFFAEEIYESYGDLDGDELEQLNHTEMPWIKARNGLKPWQGCNTVIKEDDMKEFYRSLMK